MKTPHDRSTGSALRRAAEARLNAKPAPPQKLSEVELQKLQHQLEVHQVELEMQNEELRATRAELEAGVERYTDFYDFSPVGYFSLAPDGTIWQVNLTGTKLIGIERARLVGRRLQSLVAEPDRPAFEIFLRQSFATGCQQSCEVRLLESAGRQPFVGLDATLSPAGHECRLVMLDITDRKRDELALRASEENFRQLAESITDVFWIASPDLQQIHYVSPGYERIWGRTAESLHAHPHQWIAAVVPEDRDRVAGVFASLMAREPSVSVEYRTARPDGTVRWILDRGFQVRDAAGELIRLTGVASDITQDKQTEDALRTSQERYALAERATQDGMWDWNVLTNEEYFSSRWKEILGLEHEEFAGHKPDFLNRVHPEDLAAVTEITREHLATGKRYAIEFRLRHRDGSYRWVHSRGEAVRDAAGRPLRMVGSTADITDRKHAEIELKRSERALRTISACDHALVHAATEAELLQQVCRVIVEIGGYRMAWVGFAEMDEAKTVRVAAMAGDETNYLAEVKISWSETDEHGRGPTGTAIRTGQTIVCQDTQTDPGFAPWREAARQRVYASSIALPLRHAERTFGILMIYAAETNAFQPAAVALLTTLSEDLAYGIHALRTRLERQRVQEQLDIQISALTATANAVVITDRHGKTEWVNPAFTRLTGFSAEESVGQNPRVLKSGAHPPAFYATLWATILTGNVWHGELVNKRKDGRLYTEEMTITPVRGEDSQIAHFVAIKQGVTERRQMEKQMQQAQKMEAIGQLAGGIAHDFNNMLAAMFGYAHLLQQDTAGNPLAQESVAEILTAANRAKELVRQILTFSRQREQKPQVIRLNTIVKEALKFLRASLPAHIKIEMKLAADAPAVLADPTQIYQVTMNLATNALHAMEDRPGRLLVSLDAVRPEEQLLQTLPLLKPIPYARLIVADTGHGMDAKTLERIFEPFFTTKPVGQGTGLGLAVVHGIIESHNGVITVESQVGQGTTFTLYFPAQPQDETPTATDASTVPHGHGQRILVLDDEPALTSVLQKILRRLDYQVTTSNHAVEAIRRFRENPAWFDLVITDLTMPEMNGLEVVSQLRDLRPDLPVILVSGYSVSVDADRLRAAGISERLDKPVSPIAIAEAVARALNQHAGHSETRG